MGLGAFLAPPDALGVLSWVLSVLPLLYPIYSAPSLSVHLPQFHQNQLTSPLRGRKTLLRPRRLICFSQDRGDQQGPCSYFSTPDVMLWPVLGAGWHSLPPMNQYTPASHQPVTAPPPALFIMSAALLVVMEPLGKKPRGPACRIVCGGEGLNNEPAASEGIYCAEETDQALLLRLHKPPEVVWLEGGKGDAG